MELYLSSLLRLTHFQLEHVRPKSFESKANEEVLNSAIIYA